MSLGFKSIEELFESKNQDDNKNKIKNYDNMVIENTNDLICVTKFALEPVYTYVNPSYKKILGYEPEEMIGKNSFDFIHPDDKKNLIPIIKKYISMKIKNILDKESELSETFEFH